MAQCIFKYYLIKNSKTSVKLKDIAIMYQPETISSNSFDDNGPYIVYGSGGIIGRYTKYNHKDSELMISCRGLCGSVSLSLPYSWIIGNQMIITPHDLKVKYYLYNFLKLVNLKTIETGSVQKQITRTNLENLNIEIIEDKKLIELNESLSAIYQNIIFISNVNSKLNEIKKILLPLLINSQLV